MKDIGKQVTIFQSTPPIQGATGCTSDQPQDQSNLNPRPLYRERPRSDDPDSISDNFNPRPLYRERRVLANYKGVFSYFNPRPLYRERPGEIKPTFEIKIFQSTPPIQGATKSWTVYRYELIFQSTPPIQGATLRTWNVNYISLFQSTPPIQGATEILQTV